MFSRAVSQQVFSIFFKTNRTEKNPSDKAELVSLRSIIRTFTHVLS